MYSSILAMDFLGIKLLHDDDLLLPAFLIIHFPHDFDIFNGFMRVESTC